MTSMFCELARKQPSLRTLPQDIPRWGCLVSNTQARQITTLFKTRPSCEIRLSVAIEVHKMLTNKAFLFSLTLLAAYLAAGLFAGPPLVQPWLEQYAESQLGRELRFERVRVNPLSLSVRLHSVDLVTGQQSLWPELAIEADRIDLHFNFWRLAPRVSGVTLHEPQLVLDSTRTQAQVERYPLVGLWQQWQQDLQARLGQGPAPVKKWRIEDGKVLIRTASAPATDAVVLEGLNLQADPQNRSGAREISLRFSVPDHGDVRARGMYSTADLTAAGEYQLNRVAAADGSMAELEAAGTFSSVLLADAVQIELGESRLHASRIATCLLDNLLCATLTPVQASFDSSLLAASNGVQVLHANARLSAFQLDAALGQGRFRFAAPQHFESARLELAPAPATAATGMSFGIQLNQANNDQYQIDGQVDLLARVIDARFQLSGGQYINGSAQLRSSGGQPEQAQLDLELENPAASLVQKFLDEHFNARLTSRTLQLQVAARLDDIGLRVQETVGLKQTGLLQNSGVAPSSASTFGSGPALDAQWLLALLQDADEVITLELPELTFDSVTSSGLAELIQRQALTVLTELAEHPFVGLAKAFGLSNHNLHEVSFAPGSAALDAANTRALGELAAIVSQRPRLGVAVVGVYDPVVDKKALQTEQLRTHIALATAAGLSFRTGAEPPDLNAASVRSVIDEFAQRRVPPDVMQKFVERFGYADADQGVLPEGDATTYYASLFELLVNYAEIPQGAMTTLARYRAQAVMDALTDAGVLRQRLQAAAQAVSNELAVERVPLPLQLQAWSEANPNPGIESAESANSR